MFVILRFIVGYKSTAKSSIIFGRRKIDNPSIHGKWTKPISKLRDVGIIFIVQLMRTALTLDIWLRKKRDTQAAYAFLKRLVKQFDEPKVVVTDKAPLLQVPLRN
jgi:putative transposase